MEHKVLIADDSLTIQKVIKITLSNEPFVLSDCTDADELVSSVEEFKPAIVLLDFNLSENKTGYDLCKEIKEVAPNVQILMLFGAFDTIDEGLLQGAGCSYHIVKPFDGTKFINLCRSMAQDHDSNSGDAQSSDDFDFSTDSPVTEPPVIEEENEATSDIGDDWVVNQPNVIDNDIPEPIEAETSAEVGDDLSKSMEDWGMEIPGKIDAGSDSIDHMDIPAPIDSEESYESMDMPEPIEAAQDFPEPINNEEDTQLPSNDDLEYPDMMTSSDASTEDVEEVKAPSNSDLEYPDMDSLDNLEVETSRPEPSLTPISELHDNQAEEQIEVSQGGTDSEEALKNLENEIQDEMEENDLWAADEYEVPTIEVEENYTDKEVKASEGEDFKSMDLDDLPQIEPHGLEKVVDNTDEETSSDSYQSFDDEEEHDLNNSPEDFPADVMEEDLEYPDVASMKDEVEESMDKIDDAIKTPERLVSADFEEKLQRELTEKLTPIVEEYVKEYCANSIEKIAWEIIPDLAENVIKKEIQKISDSIMDN